MTVFHIRLPDPAKARGSDPSLSFRAHGADSFAEELQHALATDVLFKRWLATQDDPDEVDPRYAEVDPDARVEGEQADLAVMLRARTSIGSAALRQRMRWLAGSQWELRDVSA